MTNRSRMRFVPTRDVFHIDGYGDAVLMDRDWSFGALSVLGPATLLSAQRAMRSMYRGQAWEEGVSDWHGHKAVHHQIKWSLDDHESFDEEMSQPEDAGLVLSAAGELLLEVDLPTIGSRRIDPFEDWTELRTVLEEWARAREAELVAVLSDEYDWRWWRALVRLPLRGRTVFDAHRLGQQCSAVAYASVQRGATLDSIAALLRAGRADALVGMHEQQVLECKRWAEINNEAGKHAFARDVAALANSPDGGILVVGLVTKRDDDSDRIVKVIDVPSQVSPRRLRAILDGKIYPPIHGLQVERVSVEGEKKSIVICIVPAQATELRPFFVYGAEVAGEVQFAYVSVPERRGEDTQNMSAASIHAFMSVGRALLRGAHNEVTG